MIWIYNNNTEESEKITIEKFVERFNTEENFSSIYTIETLQYDYPTVYSLLFQWDDLDPEVFTFSSRSDTNNYVIKLLQKYDGVNMEELKTATMEELASHYLLNDTAHWTISTMHNPTEV